MHSNAQFKRHVGVQLQLSHSRVILLYSVDHLQTLCLIVKRCLFELKSSKIRTVQLEIIGYFPPLVYN